MSLHFSYRSTYIQRLKLYENEMYYLFVGFYNTNDKVALIKFTKFIFNSANYEQLNKKNLKQIIVEESIMDIKNNKNNHKLRNTITKFHNAKANKSPTSAKHGLIKMIDKTIKELTKIKTIILDDEMKTYNEDKNNSKINDKIINLKTLGNDSPKKIILKKYKFSKDFKTKYLKAFNLRTININDKPISNHNQTLSGFETLNDKTIDFIKNRKLKFRKKSKENALNKRILEDNLPIKTENFDDRTIKRLHRTLDVCDQIKKLDYFRVYSHNKHKKRRRKDNINNITITDFDTEIHLPKIKKNQGLIKNLQKENENLQKIQKNKTVVVNNRYEKDIGDLTNFEFSDNPQA